VTVFLCVLFYSTHGWYGYIYVFVASKRGLIKPW